jgi:hypothetical protein
VSEYCAHDRAKTPNITRKLKAEQAADQGMAAGQTGAGEEEAAAQLPTAEAAAKLPRRSSWRYDSARMEELEDSVLELQAEVASLTEQVTCLMFQCPGFTVMLWSPLHQEGMQQGSELCMQMHT